MWNLIVRVPRSPEVDVAKYRLFRNGVLDGDVPQPAAGDAKYPFSSPDDGDYALTVTAVGASNNESPASDPLLAHLDHVGPAAPARLMLVAATWVP